MKNSNRPNLGLLEVAIFKFIFLIILFAVSQVYTRCTAPTSPSSVSSSVEYSNTEDSLRIERLDMGDNLHFCVDGSHKTCDGECSCDGLECEVK